MKKVRSVGTLKEKKETNAVFWCVYLLEVEVVRKSLFEVAVLRFMPNNPCLETVRKISHLFLSSFFFFN